MGFLQDGTWVIDTLGDLIEAGGSLTAYCSNRLECGRALELDVYDLALQFGRRAKLLGGRFPLKCARCGSKEVHFIRAPDTRIGEAARATPDNFRSTRPQEECEALMLLFPPRREWPARGDR